MHNVELHRQLQRIRHLIKRTSDATSGDLELQAHWARYICVLVGGFLENALSEVYTDFVRGAASEPVANFAAGHLSRIQNPKAGKFVDVAGGFKEAWRDGLEKFFDDSGRKDALDSIMANRHLIAHGRDSGITLVRVDTYLKSCVEVVEFIEGQIKT